HLGRVRGGLAAAELHFRARQDDRFPAKLTHRHVERDARARRWLVEDHRKHLAFEGLFALACLEARLMRPRIIQHKAKVGGRDGGKIDEMPRHACALSSAAASASATVRMARRT